MALEDLLNIDAILENVVNIDGNPEALLSIDDALGSPSNIDGTLEALLNIVAL
jgi:hypothetical protein